MFKLIQYLAIFPKKNLSEGTRRLRNLQEMLSPTVQTGGVGDENGHAAEEGQQRWKFDICHYMEKTSYVTFLYYGRQFTIHGRNIHFTNFTKKKIHLVCLLYIWKLELDQG